jgi:hypothetical protein
VKFSFSFSIKIYLLVWFSIQNIFMESWRNVYILTWKYVPFKIFPWELKGSKRFKTFTSYELKIRTLSRELHFFKFCVLQHSLLREVKKKTHMTHEKGKGAKINMNHHHTLYKLFFLFIFILQIEIVQD